jgi:hypothetical protein
MFQRVIGTVVLAAIATFAISTSAAAQGLGFGVKGGLVYPDFSVDVGDYEYKNKTGWQAGLWFGGNRDGIVGVQVEINYMEKKAEAESGLGDFSIKYMQVPILLRLNTPARTKNSFQAYGIVGPSIDIKVGDEFNGLNIIDEFEGTDIGLMFGGGIDVARLIVEARYSYGLRQINKSFSDVAKLKSHSFALLFGVRFN